jgi:hypothetical protein
MVEIRRIVQYYIITFVMSTGTHPQMPISCTACPSAFGGRKCNVVSGRSLSCGFFGIFLGCGTLRGIWALALRWISFRVIENALRDQGRFSFEMLGMLRVVIRVLAFWRTFSDGDSWAGPWTRSRSVGSGAPAYQSPSCV